MLKKNLENSLKYPGIPMALDRNTAVIMCEREASDAAGAYPITPSTQMGEYWAEETAKGHVNISGKALVFIEPESEHAAAAVTAGMSMSGLRATNFSSAQGIAFMHESLYAAAGKRLPYVLNIGCRGPMRPRWYQAAERLFHPPIKRSQVRNRSLNYRPAIPECARFSPLRSLRRVAG